jgi:hypothetical protein
MSEAVVDPFVDPFDEKKLLQREDRPAAGKDEYRFYYYYHRPSSRMILRVGTISVLLLAIDTVGIDTWTIEHTEPPLKFLVCGNAKQIDIADGRAVLS